MLRVTIVCTIIAVFLYLYEDVLFARKSLPAKVRQILGPLVFYAVVLVAALNIQPSSEATSASGLRTAVGTVPKEAAATGVVPVEERLAEQGTPGTEEASLSGVEEPAATGSIAAALPREPLRGRAAALACTEHATTEARMSGDIVAEKWLSSMEDFVETSPGEITARFAVGPREKALCPLEARLTCHIEGADVSITQPIYMTGQKFACKTRGE